MLCIMRCVYYKRKTEQIIYVSLNTIISRQQIELGRYFLHEVKIDDMIPRAFKLKSYRFCNKEEKELDAGITNIEDVQSENIDNDDSNSYIDEQ